MLEVDDVEVVVGRVKRGGGRSSATSNTYLSTLKHLLLFYGVAFDWRRIKLKVDIPRRRATKVDRALSVQELKRMVIAAKGRMKILVCFFCCDGAEGGRGPQS